MVNTVYQKLTVHNGIPRHICRAQNNGQATVSDQLKVPVDPSLFNLASNSDRPHKQYNYSNDDNIACSSLYNVVVNVLSV